MCTPKLRCQFWLAPICLSSSSYFQLWSSVLLPSRAALLGRNGDAAAADFISAAVGECEGGGELFMHPFPSSYFIQKIFFPGQYPSQQGRIRDCLMIKIRFSESHELPFPSKTRWGKYSRKCTVQQVKRLSWGKIFLSFACSLLCFVLPGVFFREPACCVVGWIVVWLYRQGVGKWGVPGRRNKIKNCEGLRGKRLNPTTNSLKQRRKKGVPFSTPKKNIRNLEIPFRPRKEINIFRESLVCQSLS